MNDKPQETFYDKRAADYDRLQSIRIKILHEPLCEDGQSPELYSEISRFILIEAQAK